MPTLHSFVAILKEGLIQSTDVERVEDSQYALDEDIDNVIMSDPLT